MCTFLKAIRTYECGHDEFEPYAQSGPDCGKKTAWKAKGEPPSRLPGCEQFEVWRDEENVEACELVKILPSPASLETASTHKHDAL